MKLYELDGQIELALNTYYSMFDDDWVLNASEEEFLQVQKQLEELQNKRSDFIEWLLKNRANNISNINWIDEEIKRLSEMKVRIQKKVDSAENFIEKIAKQNYTWKAINYGNWQVWFRKSTSTIIDNEEDIPQEYKKEKISISIDKTEIKKAIQEWKEIKWARLQENLNLTIK